MRDKKGCVKLCLNGLAVIYSLIYILKEGGLIKIVVKNNLMY